MRTTILTLLLLAASTTVRAETLAGAFEPLPPHITEQGGGLLPQLLERLREQQGLHFSVTMMPYSRAKRELQIGRADLIGFTPYGLEVEAFYRDAEEIRWPYPVEAGFIALSPEALHRSESGRIGIPYGNEAFAAQMLGVSSQRFYQAKLDELVLMLLRGRVDSIWFDRLALEKALEGFAELPALYFRREPSQLLTLGLAVRRNAAGARIRRQLEPLLQQMQELPLPRLSERLIRVPARTPPEGRQDLRELEQAGSAAPSVEGGNRP